MPSPHQGGTRTLWPARDWLLRRGGEATKAASVAAQVLTHLSSHSTLYPAYSHPFGTLSTTPLRRLPQVSRALTIKSQYLSKTAVELQAKRKEAEVQVESGIMGLGLLKE